VIKVDAFPIAPAVRSLSDIERDDLVRHVLEQAAKRVEAHGGNPTYVLAWKVAAKIIRGMKP
jgi:hypothetical protein